MNRCYSKAVWQQRVGRMDCISVTSTVLLLLATHFVSSSGPLLLESGMEAAAAAAAWTIYL